MRCFCCCCKFDWFLKQNYRIWLRSRFWFKVLEIYFLFPDIRCLSCKFINVFCFVVISNISCVIFRFQLSTFFFLLMWNLIACRFMSFGFWILLICYGIVIFVLRIYIGWYFQKVIELFQGILPTSQTIETLYNGMIIWQQKTTKKISQKL